MGKRTPALDPAQLGFSFEAPRPARREADLAGLDRVVASGVAQALKGDARSREEIAGAMSALLSEEVTRWMLDAYASEAREQHNISAGRFLALVAVTGRFDILDGVLFRVGTRVLVGEEVHTARVGHLRSELRRLQTELKQAERLAEPIKREARR